MKKLSLVVPCHNEAENLPHLIREITASVHRDDIEVILVNDGSTDDSAHILESLTRGSSSIRVVTNTKNQGYGGAILAGLHAAEGTYIGWMHGDLQTPFADVPRALARVESLGEPEDIYVKGLRKQRPPFDQFFTFGMSVFESVLLWEKLFDINAQPNIFHRNFFASWESPPKDFSLDLYALYMARIPALRVIRIPVMFPPRKHGQSHWNFGFRSKLKFIKRTIAFSLELQKRVHPSSIATRLGKLPFVKYLLAGGLAGFIHIALLYIFTALFSIHYLISTSLALFIVFWISFFLQKYWTFKETSSKRFRAQAGYYFVMHSLNFIANGFLMYLFVSIFGVWYMLSQIVISLSIACVTFVLNKKFIFT